MYSANILKCVLAIYMLEAQVFARHKTHTTKYKIDEFIDKLLTSKKFDVLAEKFAQKAVERMVNLRPDLRFSKDFEAKIEASPKIPFNNVSYKTDIHLKDTPSLKNLSLKFKYFTKGVIYESDEEENTRKEIVVTTAKGETKNIRKEIAMTTAKTDYEKRTESDSDDDDDDKSVNISDLESSLQDKPENKSENRESKHNIQREDDKTSTKNKTREETDDKSSVSIENKKNAELSENEITENHENHKANKTHVQHNGAISDFDKNVRKDRTLFSNESNEINSTKFKKPRKKRIHREGNRLYTFQSSSDYEEYHQELERVEKRKKVFV